MEKKDTKKIDFLKISEEKQGEIIKEALAMGQQEQKKLEEKYYQVIMKGTAA